jgi:hypothetical protein
MDKITCLHCKGLRKGLREENMLKNIYSLEFFLVSG